MSGNRVLVPEIIAPRLKGPTPDGGVESISGTSMGTTWTVRAVRTEAGVDLRCLIEAALDEVVTQMSTWLPSSALSRFNRAAAGTQCSLPAECFQVLHYALWLAQVTDGAYDPSIGALSNIWGFGPAGPRTSAPSTEEIAWARARTGWRRLSISGARRSVHQPGDLEIDVSSIAKGFAVDHVARRLEAHGIDHHLIEIGGELRGAGCKSDGAPWWVEIECAGPAEAPRTLVALHELSMATSGDYRRYLQINGARYSHTIDPRTGWPITHGLTSVTVLARECMHADALATALHVLGLKHGMEFATEHQIAAIFQQRMNDKLEHHLSPVAQRYLS